VSHPEPNHAAMRQALSRRRADLGYTYDKLAELTGLSRTGVINIELGTRTGALATWFALAHALDLPLGELVGHLDDPT
jgi:putative transcriptional regulator